MPTPLSLSKTAAREQLRRMAPIRLRRPVFFVPGWRDQGGCCWTQPYVEDGADCRPGWEYTVQDWVAQWVRPADRTQVHFVRLVEQEERLRENPPAWEQDATSRYENFFQFAELLKGRIRASGIEEYDLVGHSMGGLDSIAAIILDVAVDGEPEVNAFINSPPLEGAARLITVATPFRGSPTAELVKRTQFDELLMPNWLPGIRKQAEAMATSSPFIHIITSREREQRLIQRVPGGVHTFGSYNDLVVPSTHRMIAGATNHPAADFQLARHSQRLGIPQDPRLALAVFSILSGGLHGPE